MRVDRGNLDYVRVTVPLAPKPSGCFRKDGNRVLTDPALLNLPDLTLAEEEAARSEPGYSR